MGLEARWFYEAVIEIAPTSLICTCYLSYCFRPHAGNYVGKDPCTSLHVRECAWFISHVLFEGSTRSEKSR